MKRTSGKRWISLVLALCLCLLVGCGGKQTGKSSFAHSLFTLNYKGMRKTPGINKISELLNNSFISCKVCFFHNLLTAF